MLRWTVRMFAKWGNRAEATPGGVYCQSWEFIDRESESKSLIFSKYKTRFFPPHFSNYLSGAVNFCQWKQAHFALSYWRRPLYCSAFLLENTSTHKIILLWQHRTSAVFCIWNSNNILYASSIRHMNLQQQDGLSFSSHAYCAHLFQDCDPAVKWAAQECESCPLEATIRRVTAALIKTSRGRCREGGGTHWLGRFASIFKASNKEKQTEW